MIFLRKEVFFFISAYFLICVGPNTVNRFGWVVMFYYTLIYDWSERAVECLKQYIVVKKIIINGMEKPAIDRLNQWNISEKTELWDNWLTLNSSKLVVKTLCQDKLKLSDCMVCHIAKYWTDRRTSEKLEWSSFTFGVSE